MFPAPESTPESAPEAASDVPGPAATLTCSCSCEAEHPVHAWPGCICPCPLVPLPPSASSSAPATDAASSSSSECEGPSAATVAGRSKRPVGFLSAALLPPPSYARTSASALLPAALLGISTQTTVMCSNSMYRQTLPIITTVPALPAASGT